MLQAIVRDVRDRLRIENELRKSARRFEELYRVAVVLGDDPAALADHTVAALTAVLECSDRGRLDRRGRGDARARRRAAEGRPASRERRLAGTPCAEVVARAVPCVFTDAAARFPDDRPLVAAGVRVYCGAPILDAGGAVIGIVSVVDTKARTFRDEDVQLVASFARRIGQALERERLSAERDALTERLVESDRLKTEFLGMMSHELRTPLNILLGYTRMLLEAVDDGDVMTGAERRDVCERMLAGGLHLGDLVEDTLSVLRLEAGVMQVDAAPLALDAFFEELQSLDRLLRRPSDVTERWEVDPRVPHLVHRPPEASPGRHEPRGERPEVHGPRRHRGPRRRRPVERRRPAHRARHGLRHRPRASPVRLRPLPAGAVRAPQRGMRARSLHRAALR